MTYLTILWLLLILTWLLTMALAWALMTTSAQADRNAERIMELVDNQPWYEK